MKDGSKDKDFMVRVGDNDSYVSDDAVAYSIEYKVKGTRVEGTMSSGTVYIRGTKGYDGGDSFKFVLEKANDFSDFDAQLIMNAYQQAFKSAKPVPKKVDYGDMPPAKRKFMEKMAAKSAEGSNQ